MFSDTFNGFNHFNILLCTSGGCIRTGEGVCSGTVRNFYASGRPEVWCKIYWPDRKNTDGILAPLRVPGLIQEKGCSYFLVDWEMKEGEWQLLSLQLHLLFFNGEYTMRVCAYSGPSTFINELGFLDLKMSTPEKKSSQLVLFFYPLLEGWSCPWKAPLYFATSV